MGLTEFELCYSRYSFLKFFCDYFRKIFEVSLSKLESSDELSEVTKLNAEISSLDIVLVSCEHSVINLEQHIDTATRLSARVANIRSRYETLKQRNAAA